MDLRLVVAIGFVFLFYRAAAYERLSGWLWAVASLVLSLAAMGLWSGSLPVIVIQVGFFGVLWWYNGRCRARRQQEWVAKRQGRRRADAERMRRAQEEIRRDRQRREVDS